MTLLDSAGADQVKAAACRDQKSRRDEFLFKPPKPLDMALCALLNDSRDAPLAYLIFNILSTTAPAAALLFWWRPASNWPGLLYVVANYVLYLQRFMLMLHFSEHRRLFKKEYGALNQLVPLLLCPLFGVPSGMYRLHHCIMHHTEDNKQGWDLSSTEPYQRDNFLHFIWYWLRYSVLGWVELPLYAARRRRWGVLAACLATELGYLAGVRALWQLAPLATKWVFVVPFVLSSFALMFGNWSQHIFVDPANPRSDYRLTYNCVDCPDNSRTFNDGYHIVHHLNSQLHWSELPTKFSQTLEKHAEEDALVFRGIGFFDVGLAVFTRRYGFLVRHLVRYSSRLAAKSDAELAALLRSRLAPVR